MEKYKKILKQPVNVLYAFSLIGCMFIATLALTNLLDKKIDEIFSKADLLSYSNFQHAQVSASLSSGLISHFKLDEVSGTTVTDSAGSTNGTVVGGNPTWMAGKIGSGSLNLNGTNQYVDVPNFNAINGLNTVSISFWVKPSAVSKPFITKWGTGRLFEIGSNGTSLSVIWRIGGTGGGGTSLSQTTSNNTLTTGVWNHVVVVYNSPSSIVYVNGNQVGSVNGAGGSLNSSVNDSLRIGWNNIPSFYSGDIDDVRIYNRSVTSQEVYDLYSLSGSVAPGPISTTNSSSANTQPSNTITTTTSNSVAPTVTTQTANPTTVVNTQNISAGCAGASTKCVPEEYATIQACANVADAGDTCLVSAGTYSEQVMTKKNGTSDTNRITFKANGKAVVNGFDIRNAYITVDGFDITGPSVNQQYIGITKGGDYCKVLNNTIHDGVKKVSGISFYSSSSSGGITGNYCLFKGNTLTRINSTYLTTDGTGSRFENNVFEEAGGWDLVRAFGQDHVFYRNVFRNSIPATGIGNHPDFIQTFSDNGGKGFNMLFEENWIENLSAITETGYQLGQMNSGGGINDPKLSPNFHDFTFRRNVFANVSNNWNLGVPGITFENNTFYRTAYTQDGLVSGGSLTRGDSSRMVITNNAFIGGGKGGDTQGFYSSSGAGLGQEILRFYVTFETATEASPQTPIAAAIMNELISNGYTDGNGYPTAKAKALKSESDLNISATYATYKSGIYKYLKATIDLDNNIRNTFVANYNFVSGPASLGYPAKRSDGCVGTNTNFRFCEQNGVNGGDPKLKNVNDPDGPDNIPFTTDDGLKPIAGSPLCGKGFNGVDIGVYSCDANKVFATGNSGTGGIIVAPPTTPTTPTNPPVVNPPVSTVGIIYVSNSGNDTNTGAQASPLKTIQRCANIVKAGETCLVSAGTYPEHVETLNGGTSGKYVNFKAQGKVTMKGFRIKNPYVRVEGFDITKYDVGLDQGHIAIEPEGDYTQIINNTIRDGIYLTSNSFTFNAANKTITNPSGGFVAAGFVPGVTIYIGSDINNQILNHDNNGAVPYKYETKKVIAVTDTTLTLDPSNTVFSEGPVSATIYVNKAEKNGVWGVIFNSSTSRGQPDNCLIQGNTFRNLAGKGIQIAGSNNIVERNIFERMNGWRMISFYGNNNVFRYNTFKDSPRWPGFQLPKPGTVFALGSGSWDMYDTLMTSTGAIDQQVNDNVFEYNFIKDVDEQLASVEETAPAGTALQNKGLYIRNNVFINVEMSGSFTRPQTILSNNTFYKSARISNQNFVIGKSTHGNPIGSQIVNNAFVDSGVQNGNPTDGGWYSVRGEDGKATPGVLADFNFVAGSSIHNYPSKASFKNDNLEANGINGGDPKFVNPSNPLGPDGIAFTSDDGLIPLSTSPLCRGGQSGTYIGAYPCNGVSVPNPNPNPNTDTVAPVITSITASSIDESSANITWSTNETSDSQIEYGLTTAYGNSTAIVLAPVVSHSQKLTNLSSNTTYHFRVKSKDAAGNTQVSADQVFTTAKPVVITVDTTAPIITTPKEVIVVPAGTYSTKLNITTNESAVCKWSNKSGVPYTSMTNQFTFSNNVYTADITNLLTGLNIVYVKCVDMKGNANLTDSVVNISVGSQVPVVSDSDSDGISNDIDKCPNTKAHTPVNQKGCPVPRLSKFLSNDISSLDLNSVSNLELKNSLGKVNFETGNYSLVKKTGESLDIDSNLTISKGLVYLDSTNVPELNKPATITLYNITVAKPKIMRDGVVCDKCIIISYINNTLVFTVPGFSTYEVIDELAPPVVSNQEPSSNTSSGSSRSGGSRSGGSSSVSQSIFTRSLSITATGEDVRQLQIFLNSKGYTVTTSGVGSRGNESTYFGPATKAALIRFQISKGIAATGIFDTQTMTVVNSLYSSTNTVSTPIAPSIPSTTTKYTFSRSLTVGATGEDVRQLQIFLNTKGFTVTTSGVGSRGNESTYFGPATRAALVKYQISNGINPAVGFFGPVTRARVNLQK